MLLHSCVKLVTLAVLLLLIRFEEVENYLIRYFYSLVNENHRLKDLKLERSINSQVLNGTIHENGIIYVEINKMNPKLTKIKKIEDEFRNIVSMNGVKYIYKRSFYWRTWRTVTDSKGNESLVCYRCQNIINVTCPTCDCGYWEIEENPPCPFEVFSVINNTNVCAAFYDELKHTNTNCPSIVSFTDLAKCDNPLETRWRVNRQYDSTNVPERYGNVICKEREKCEFLTTYSITQHHVMFRIIDSSNHIVYSRIMKNDNLNYACVDNCGVYESMYSKNNGVQTMKRLQFTASQNNIKKKLHLEEITKDYTNVLPINFKSYTENLHGLPKKHRNSINFIKDVITPSTLGCKHLQNTHSEEESEESEYNDY